MFWNIVYLLNIVYITFSFKENLVAPRPTEILGQGKI